jgi:hypothetical protein
MWSFRYLETFAQDLRFSLRMMSKNPGSSITLKRGLIDYLRGRISMAGHGKGRPKPVSRVRMSIGAHGGLTRYSPFESIRN